MKIDRTNSGQLEQTYITFIYQATRDFQGQVDSVLVFCYEVTDHAVLEVQDNGLGLDLVQGQDKLFTMFQRLHTHVEGTGVGLYMVKCILENAGGRIEVTSQLGQGSTFRAYFQR